MQHIETLFQHVCGMCVRMCKLMCMYECLSELPPDSIYKCCGYPVGDGMRKGVYVADIFF